MGTKWILTLSNSDTFQSPVRIEAANSLARHELAQPSQAGQGEPVGILVGMLLVLF